MPPKKKPPKSSTSKTKAKATKATKPKTKAPVKRAAPKVKGSPVIGSLSLVTLHVTDLDRALEFYRDTLELPEGEHVPQARWLEFDLGAVTLGIHADPEHREEGSREPGMSTGFFFNVPDCDASVATLRARGVKIVHEPSDMPYGREATFMDLDGNLIAVLQPRTV